MKRYVVAGLGIVGLTALGLMVYGLSLLPHWAVLVWAILATLLLPVLALAGWALGRYEAGATLYGFDMGIDRVASALIRLHTREAKAPVNVAVLPQMPPVVHQQLTDGKGEVVDL